MKITKKEWKAITKAAQTDNPAGIIFIVKDWHRMAEKLQRWIQQNLETGQAAGLHVVDVVLAELDRAYAKKRKGGGQ